MQVVLENLIGNAWKYTSKQDSAAIEFGKTEENGETVYFVRDNGAGFNPRYADRLFRPFQRLHSQSEFAGTGRRSCDSLPDHYPPRRQDMGQRRGGQRRYFLLHRSVR